MIYTWLNKWHELEVLELQSTKINKIQQETREFHANMMKLFLLEENILEWEITDVEYFHFKRISLDSILYCFNISYLSKCIDSVRHLLDAHKKFQYYAGTGLMMQKVFVMQFPDSHHYTEGTDAYDKKTTP